MQPKIRITLCNRCGGMKLGWNKRYMKHWLWCKQGRRPPGLEVWCSLWRLSPWFSRTQRLSDLSPGAGAAGAEEGKRFRNRDSDSGGTPGPLNECFSRAHKVSEENRGRLAQSLVESARKHGLNPKLLASVMIVESRGNPSAISGQDAVGIMQIHLPTWGEKADRENINLLKIEDNVDFGARILKDYVSRFGLSGGVRRYNGYIPGEPVWEESSQRYLEKVQQVYEIQLHTAQASLTK